MTKELFKSNILKKIWWIGGSPGAGKTSLAKALGEKYNLYVYHCDEHYKQHIACSTQKEHPTIHRLAPMSEDEFWMRPVEQQYTDAIEFYQEEFKIMMNNISVLLHQESSIIIEGTIVMPQLLTELNIPKERAIWLVPTSDFQRKQHLTRGDWVYNILSQCKNPSVALENWMQRDEIFAQNIINICIDKALPCYIVDGSLNKLEIFKLIEQYFLNFGFPY